MLGKLLKYDLKALSRILIPVHLAAVAVTFVACGAALTSCPPWRRRTTRTPSWRSRRSCW